MSPPLRPGELRPRNRPFSTLSGRPPGVAVETKRRPCSQAGVCRTTHVAPFRELASTLGESKISGGRDCLCVWGGGNKRRTNYDLHAVYFVSLSPVYPVPNLRPDPITPARQLLVSRWAPSIGFLAIGPPYGLRTRCHTPSDDMLDWCGPPDDAHWPARRIGCWLEL